MEALIFWGIGMAIVIGVFIMNVRRGNQHESDYRDGFYHGTHDSSHGGRAGDGGDWGGRDMSHDHHGGYDSDAGGHGGDGGGGDGGGGGG